MEQINRMIFLENLCNDYLRNPPTKWNFISSKAKNKRNPKFYQYLLKDPDLYEWLIQNNKLIDLKILHQLTLKGGETPPWSWYYTAIASGNGNIPMLKYLFENGCPRYALMCIEAAKNNHLECLQYLIRLGYLRGSLTLLCSRIAGNGHLDMLKFIHYYYKHNYTKEMKADFDLWDYNTCVEAATYGHLDCLKYAHENGCPMTFWRICDVAACGGHLKCLKYAHENGCNWKIQVTSNAALNDNLECLRYAHEHGCPWGFRVYIEDSPLCYKYAEDHGCPKDEDWNSKYRYDVFCKKCQKTVHVD